MKTDIHPEWHSEATVVCQCGNTWTTGATKSEIRTEICSNCHPFYTGEQRIVDTEGRIDKFLSRLQRRDEIREEQLAREESEEDTGPDLDVPIEDLGLGSRFKNVLEESGILTIGDILNRFEEAGEEGITDISGLGAQALIDIKKGLRSMGYTLPMDDDTEETTDE